LYIYFVQLGNIISRIRGESKTVGLDIGHRLVKVAVVEHKPGTKGTLLALKKDTLPDGVVVDNEIRNVAVLMDKVQSLLARAMPDGIDGDLVASINWASGILCDRILVKPVPKVPENELILQAAMGRSPFDDAGNVLDYFVLDRREEGIEAMIVAAKKDGLTSWMNLFQALGIKVFAIDVDVFVLCNAYYAAKAYSSSSRSYDDDDDSVLLLNIGYSKSYAALLRNGHFVTARSIFGGAIQELQEQLSGSMGISADKCGELLMGIRSKESNLDETQVKSAKEFIFEEIAMKVDTALRYFSSSENYSNPSKILLTGGGSNIPGLTSFLTDRLSLDSAQLNPFRAVDIGSQCHLGSEDNSMSSLYTVALGLALRRF
jgi:type IV pilus assembly protein PilM